MNNAELRGMLNKLARLIVLSRAIPAQLLSKAQRLYHRLEMEASELPQKKMRDVRKEDEQFEGNKHFLRSGNSSAAEFSKTYKTTAACGRRHRANLPRNYYSAV